MEREATKRRRRRMLKKEKIGKGEREYKVVGALIPKQKF